MYKKLLNVQIILSWRLYFMLVSNIIILVSNISPLIYVK